VSTACSSSVGSGCDARDSAACTRILFIGNSYTSVNDLPATFASLARSGGHSVQTAMVAQGGAYLADEVGSDAVATSLRATAWNVIVLQEQSQVPAVPAVRARQMDPAARTLTATVRGVGALPILFQTWAHRDGWPEQGLADYAAMQLGLDDGYLATARELAVAVAPVGAAWSVVRRAGPGIELWQSDGSHPTVAGTYLAACVFYAVLFRSSPEGLALPDGVSASDGALLQRVAATTVLSDASRWGLR